MFAPYAPFAVGPMTYDQIQVFIGIVAVILMIVTVLYFLVISLGPYVSSRLAATFATGTDRGTPRSTGDGAGRDGGSDDAT